MRYLVLPCWGVIIKPPSLTLLLSITFSVILQCMSLSTPQWNVAGWQWEGVVGLVIVPPATDLLLSTTVTRTHTHTHSFKSLSSPLKWSCLHVCKINHTKREQGTNVYLFYCQKSQNTPLILTLNWCLRPNPTGNKWLHTAFTRHRCEGKWSIHLWC